MPKKFYVIDRIEKVCSKCKINKLVSDFNFNKRQPDGRSVYCRSCLSDAKVRDRLKISEARYRENNRALIAERTKTYAIKNPEKIKNQSLKRKYGISLDIFNSMFVDQNGCCKVCKTHQSELKKTLCVDHCHRTGKVRGLLCDSCNRALGSTKDNIEILENLAQYLEDSKNAEYH